MSHEGSRKAGSRSFQCKSGSVLPSPAMSYIISACSEQGKMIARFRMGTGTSRAKLSYATADSGNSSN